MQNADEGKRWKQTHTVTPRDHYGRMQRSKLVQHDDTQTQNKQVAEVEKYRLTLDEYRTTEWHDQKIREQTLKYERDRT